MSIAFGAAGAFSGGTTTLSLAFPTGITAGQLLVMPVINKYPPNEPATPTGWNRVGKIDGGVGADANDSGHVGLTAFIKVADGTETGNQAVSISSGNSSAGRIFRYTKAANRSWGVAIGSVPSNSVGALSWSVTGSDNISMRNGDVVIVISGQNSDGYSWASQLLSATGCTFGAMTERSDNNSTQGDDLGYVVTEHPCTSGPPSAPPTYTATLTGSVTAVRPAGCTLFLVLKEFVALSTWNKSQLMIY